MQTAPRPSNESARIETIKQLDLMNPVAISAYERIVDLVSIATGLDVTLFSIVGESDQFFKAKRGTELTGSPREQAFCAWTILADDDNDIMVVEDATKDERFDDNPLVTGDAGIRFYAGIPVKAPNQVTVGTACLIDTKPRKLDAKTERVLRAAKGLLEEALILQGQSVRDHLTGLFNRRFFDESLDTEWRRAFRQMLPMTVMLADVDHFKPYNDLYGHPAGDDVLRKVSDAIQNKVRRAGDLTARYGGEEFVLILPETDAEGARQVAKLLCDTIYNLKIEHQSGIDQRVTISVGAAVAVTKADLMLGQLALLSLADDALYDAKRSGRNQTRVRTVEQNAPAPDEHSLKRTTDKA